MEFVKCRADSKLMTNRRSFGDRFDQPVSVAMLSGNKTSNLPPSKEGGQGDCGQTGKKALSEHKVSSKKRQPLIRTAGWALACALGAHANYKGDRMEEVQNNLTEVDDRSGNVHSIDKVLENQQQASQHVATTLVGGAHPTSLVWLR